MLFSARDIVMLHHIVVGQVGMLDSDLLEGMFRLRNLVFNQRLGWQVTSQNEQERDLYDELDPTYLIAYNDNRRVDGCWRFLPTTGKYMLNDIFATLLGADSPPHDPTQWELSRFAVRPQTKDNRRQAHMSMLTLQMAKAAFCFAQDQGINQYVTVTSTAIERMFRGLGIPMSRLGDGQPQRIGTTSTVACRIFLNDDYYIALFGLPAAQSLAG